MRVQLAFDSIKIKLMKPRENIINLKAYEVKDDPYILKLDANESIDYFKDEILEINAIERYPDFDSSILRKALSKDLNISKESITMGNGSSELLDLLFKSFIDKGDVILSFDPSFSMYEIYANIYEASFIKISSRSDFSLHIDDMIDKLCLNPKIIILCTPNNPTGYQIPKKDMLLLLSKTDALVIVDEAYMEFSTADQTMMYDIETFQNLAVLRTFSKAYGLAGARLGYMISSPYLTSLVTKIRSPYHVNALSQALGLKAIEKKYIMIEGIHRTREARDFLVLILKKLGFIVYPSQANFVFIESPIVKLHEKLKEKGILIRHMNYLSKSYYRITVTHIYDMDLLIKNIKEIMDETK